MRDVDLKSLIRLIQRDHPSLEDHDRVSLLKTLRAFQDLMKTQSEIRKYVLKQLGPPFAGACHDALAAGRELRLRHVEVIEKFWSNGEVLRPVVEQCVFHASRKAYLGFLDLEMRVTEHLLCVYLSVFDIETFEAARELGS